MSRFKSAAIRNSYLSQNTVLNEYKEKDIYKNILTEDNIKLMSFIKNQKVKDK